jgi:hypothetical protein
MGKKWIIIIGILFFTSNKGLYTQNIKEFSKDSELFFAELNDMFSKVSVNEHKDLCHKMMDKFTEYWNSGVYTKEIKENMRDISNRLLGRRLKAYPDFYNYFSCMNGLKEYDHPVESYRAWEKTVSMLVNDKRSTKPLKDFLQTSIELLYENVLYRSNATEWKSSTSSYLFDFDTVPVVRFEKLNLTCYSNKDSALIYDTQGNFYPLRSIWKGQKGKVNWVRAGFPEDEVHAYLKNYEIYLGFSKYVADSVKFFHKNYWSKALLGTFEEKVLANVTTENASYPRFRSYFMNIEIKDVFNDIDFIGGIEMHGSKLFGLGDEKQDAYLSFKKENKEFVKILSRNIVIYPDRLASALASATIICEEDSIYHPGLQLNYIDESKELSLIRTGEGTSKSPFYDSYHSLDIYSEAIYWKMGEPTINFEPVKGTSGSAAAAFESSNYFSEARYLKLQGIDLMNPLNVIKNYTDKYNVREVGVQALSEEILMPQEQVIAMLVNLSNKGFVIYDRTNKTAFVKEKLFDYISAMNRKIDYDVLQFNSKTTRMQNASLELDSFSLKIYGVPVVFLSDSQNVFIYPKNEQLMVKKGMDFNFSGRIHAGSFDFYASKCDFSYNQFKLGMPVIDSMSFMVQSFETNENGERYPVKVKNVISDLGGDLYIDEPNNKSGLKPFPNYPIFNSTKDAYVYYDKPSIFNGIYNREKFYFYVYPFTIDSLDNFKTELLEFSGYLASAGIFPDIEDTLRVQRDYSLGFITKTPADGYPVYGGKGTYFAAISLNNDGLRGKGSMAYLASNSMSDDYMFFPDSCNALVKEFVIAEQLTPIEYPAVKGLNALQHWIPYEDKMIFRQQELPFTMFNQQSNLAGMLVLTPQELRGAGTMSFEDAEMQSKMYSFKQHEIFADSADFNLTSTELGQSAFSTKNYKSHIDFNNRKGEFASNGGASFVEFPVNQYICSIDEFDWFMDSYEIAIGSAEKETEMASYDNLTIRELIDVPLEGSEFISIHPDQDSLSFISTISTYNLKEFILYAEDVKYIRVADAAIFPSDKKIVINPGAKMNTISDAKILTNTVTRYHEIYDAVVDIKGKNKYSGIGNYDYVDEKQFRQKIFMKDIGVDPSYQTVGNGYVSDTTGFTISNDFDFAGNILLYANREFLNFDGGFRIRHTCSPGRRSWVKFNSDINPQDIYIKVDENLVTLDKNPIEAALMFSEEANRFYAGFLTPKRAASDQSILAANGYIKFNKDTETYEIAAQDKLKGLTSGGNQLTLDRKKCVLTAQGQFKLGAELGRVAMGVYGTSKHYIIPDSTSFDFVLAIDFPFDDKALSLMGENISGKNLQGVNLVKPEFLKALTDILGDKEAEKVISDLRLFGKFRRYPTELEHTMFFTEVKFKWNYATRSYISYGPIGIGSIGNMQINKFVDGYIEIERKRTGDVLNVYLEFENGKYWYFFNYRNNLMQTISANTEYNTLIQELKDDKRTEKQNKEGEEYTYIISNLRKKTDFLMKVKQ